MANKPDFKGATSKVRKAHYHQKGKRIMANYVSQIFHSPITVKLIVCEALPSRLWLFFLSVMVERRC
jgi:hypothetical protein